MVTTIVPAVFAGRRIPWLQAAALFILGSTLGGVLSGALFGLGGGISFAVWPGLRGPTRIILLVGALGYALHELGHLRLPSLAIRRQVPGRLRQRLPAPIFAFVYGLDLGSGILTRIATSALYVICFASLVSGSVWFGALLMGTFGSARAILTMGLSADLQSMDAAIARTSSLLRWQPAVHLMSAMSLVVFAMTYGLQLS